MSPNGIDWQETGLSPGIFPDIVSTMQTKVLNSMVRLSIGTRLIALTGSLFIADNYYQ